ncbi:STM3941 family protein [Chryseobacterium indologenes]|uniref:STM3941 family protein n=1 Tax=Chryseobacterium indologenes TaxID=253 RepID=UPI0009A1E7F6|nr:STM3941 family protein [Chryseobacterium indologenes]
MNTIEIKSSKTKLILLVLGSLIFTILGVFFVVSPHKFASFIFRSVTIIRMVGIVAILFFGLCLIILIKSLLTKKFNLIINEKGIIDNSSYVSVGLIFWNDINSIKRIDVVSTKFLIINVKDPNKYLNKQSGIKRKILERTNKIYGTPISISSATLSYNFDEFEKTISEFYNEYKNAPK